MVLLLARYRDLRYKAPASGFFGALRVAGLALEVAYKVSRDKSLGQVTGADLAEVRISRNRKPRQKHSFIGIPSVTISAAVAKDRVIMWHEVPGTWNGQQAADMYSGPLLKALKRTWGVNKRKFTIVEDGDTKGNQSGKGMKAKADKKIEPLTLPPRTPSLMPLDYAIWKKIVDETIAGAPNRTETKKEHLKRLQKVAKGLSRTYVSKVIRRMPANIDALIAAKGYTPKND